MSVYQHATDSEELSPNVEPGVLADVQLSHECLPLTRAARTESTMRVRPEYWSPDPTTGHQWLYVTANNPNGRFESFEDKLPSELAVVEVECMEQYDTRRVYRIAVDESGIVVPPLATAAGARIIDQWIDATGWHLSVRFSDREALLAFNEGCRDEGVDVTVNKLRQANAEGDAFVGLTEKQQTVLTVAMEHGYFNVPRNISQDELATKLGVSKSAISQRIRRAMGELVDATLDINDDQSHSES